MDSATTAAAATRFYPPIHGAGNLRGNTAEAKYSNVDWLDPDGQP